MKDYEKLQMICDCVSDKIVDSDEALSVISSKPKGGKGACVYTCATKLLQRGKKCLILSTENEKDYVVAWILATLSDFSFNQIYKNFQLMTDDDKSMLNAIYQKYLVNTEAMILYFDDFSENNLSRLAKEIQDAEIDFVLIDYIKFIDIREGLVMSQWMLDLQEVCGVKFIVSTQPPIDNNVYSLNKTLSYFESASIYDMEHVRRQLR